LRLDTSAADNREKAAEGRRSPRRKRLLINPELRDSVLECASPSALAARQSAATARRRLALWNEGEYAGQP